MAKERLAGSLTHRKGNAMSGERAIAQAVARIKASTRMNAGIRAMRDREREFDSPTNMLYSGICQIPEARQMLDDAITNVWQRERFGLFRPDVFPEIVIGGGVHAAVFSAVRYLTRSPFNRKPLVIEATDRPGGIFAVGPDPSFYLNSSNRPGQLGQPGRTESLNYLPGAPVQASDLSSLEYSANTDIGFIVRLMLGLYADVIPNFRVTSIDISSDPIRISDERGMEIKASRIIDARGLGDPRTPAEPNGTTLLSFPQWMQRIGGTQSPLRGLNRVAVIGDGDAANVVTESLLGLGPRMAGTVASLDYLRSIDWYGQSVPISPGEWRDSVRSRYLGIAPSIGRRVNVIQRRAQITASYNSVLVNGRTYDMAIMATGWNVPSLGTDDDSEYFSKCDANGNPGRNETAVARYQRYAPGFARYLRIGPRAELPFTDAEYEIPAITRNGNNRVAIFRTVPGTASLAANLPRP